MRILNLQNTVLVSLVVAGFATSACSSSDAARPTGTAGSTSSGGTGTSAGGTGISAGGTGNGTAGSVSSGAGTSAGGTTTTGGTTGAPSVCDGLGTKVLTADNTFIEDFEEPMISLGWSSFNDLGTPGVDAADNMIKILQVAGGAVNTAHSGQYKGMGANPSKTAPGFGVGTIFNVAIDNTAKVYCADISAFDGISFWAKTGIDMSTVNVNFVLPSTNQKSTDPTIGGGDCTVGCYNHPYKTTTLTTAWAQYTVKFADAGGGSAKVAPKNVIQELGWLSPDATWDFSLDEIAFYKGTAPAGAVGTSGSGGSGGSN